MEATKPGDNKCSHRVCFGVSKESWRDPETGFCTDCLVARMTDFLNDEFIGNQLTPQRKADFACRIISLLETIPDEVVAKAFNE